MDARYNANIAKALEVILWLAEREPEIDFHKVLELLYFADKYHLNKYGRPIVGGRYHAHECGPVCRPVYDLLVGEPLTVATVERNGELPFEVVGRYRLRAQRSPNIRRLSESDIEALEDAYQRFGHLDFRDLTELGHEEPAYIKADGREMRYEDFLEESPDRGERAEDLAEISRHAIV